MESLTENKHDDVVHVVLKLFLLKKTSRDFVSYFHYKKTTTL